MAYTCWNCFREKSNNDACPFCGYEPKQEKERFPLALPEGTILGGRYIVGRVLGEGGFGITYVAQEYATKRLVAIKEYLPGEMATRTVTHEIMPLSGLRQEEYTYGKECFVNEAKTLAEFQTEENIVSIYSYFEENNTAYFAMEYVDGISLQQYMREHGGRLSPDEAGQLLRPVMEAVGKIHRKGIVHRDISPDNILITKDGTAKLIDFGAARYSIGQKSMSLDVVLKHGFAPMEQYSRRGKQGPFTDVYAMAATYYYAITGKVPPDAIDRVTDDQLQLPHELGIKIKKNQENALKKGLSVKAEDRFQSMHEFADALCPANIKKEGEEKRQPEKTEQNREKKRVKTGVLIGTAVFFLLITFGGVKLAGTIQRNNTSEKDNENKPTYSYSESSSFISDAFIDPLADWSQYDALISAIKAETDYAKRTEMMHEAEDILMATGCVIPIYYYNDIYLQKDYVSDIYSNPFATKFFMYTKMSNGSDTLRMNLSSEPITLDPALNTTVDGMCLAANSFSGLYTYNADGVTTPACATGYEVSEDGLTYTVTLRKGLKWSDGTDLTAADFEYSWKRAANDETAADYAYMFSGFEGYPNDLAVTALDDVTLQFVLSAPCAYMEDLMAFSTFYPVKQKAVESYTGWRSNPGGWCQEAGFISNGAYVCTSWDHDVSMIYEKNPYWYDAENVIVKKLNLMLSTDDYAVYAAYNAGEIDFSDNDPFYQADDPDVHIVDELGTYYVAVNAKSSLFKGKTPEQAAAMRRAFSLLIDRNYICENIGQTGQVAANAFVPLGMADGNGSIFKTNVTEEGYFDPYAINNDYNGTVAKAIELLEYAGYKFSEDGKLSTETPIQFEYLTNTTSGHIKIAEIIQKNLGVIGIKMSIKQQDWNVFLGERQAGNFDIAREGWIADFNDPINMLEMWITESGYNDCQFGR